MKKVTIPEIKGVKLIEWDSSALFLSDPISFPSSGPWSIDFQTGGGTSFTGSSMTLVVSNTVDGLFKPLSVAMTGIALTDETVISGDNFPFRYMQLQYNAGTSTGPLSIIMTQD